MIAIRDRQFWRGMILGVVFIAVCSVAASAADSITGVVRNQTRGQVAAGAEVILFRLIEPSVDTQSLQPSMQEEARTHTDSQGHFTFDVKYPNQPHLVRVVYRGVNYDQQASVGETISIEVFDAVSRVQGVTGSIEIIRIGAQGNHLHVSDMIEIRNDSNPPLTQAGNSTFETYLPAHAELDSALAAGPGRIASLISATPVPGDPGHYAVNFPLQPGATKFAFNYNLPYAGHAAFRTKNVYPLQQLAVMIPATMKFTSRSAAFQILRTGNDRYQVEAANLVRAGEGPAFEISGIGPLPALQAQSPAKAPVPVPPAPAPKVAVKPQAATQAANGLDARAPLGIFARSSQAQSQEKWLVLVTGAVMLGVYGILFWGARRLSNKATTKAEHAKTVQEATQTASAPASMLGALTTELRQLEIDRSLGTITGEEYASAKQALEGTVKRALARAGAN
ncbi:MAG: hypothetical protein WBD45_24445 [Terriglobales bacterium]